MTGRVIRAVIVDDEPLACRRIRRMLRADPEVEVTEVCHNGEQALKAIREHHPDLLFLDVQMPGMDGFSVLKALPAEETPHIIFVTAYERYAIQAFDVHALDYLLKPFDRERFEKAVARAKSHIHSSGKAALQEHLSALRQELASRPKYLERLAIKSSGRIFFLKSREIDWIEAQGKYVSIHAGKDSHLVRESLGTLENELDPSRFVRIHRSTIVNIDSVGELQPWFHGDCRVLMRDGTQLMLSRNYRSRLEQVFGRPI